MSITPLNVKIDRVIDVYKEIGNIAITLEAGDRIRSLIEPSLSRGEKVAISFQGVSIYAAPFFNAAFGQLYKTFSPYDIAIRLFPANMTTLGHEIMVQTCINSYSYYSDRDRRTAVDCAIKDFAINQSDRRVI